MQQAALKRTEASRSLSIADRQTSPFRYFLAERCLEQALLQRLLSWFEDGAPWRLVETDFYEQYEFSLRHVELPEEVAEIVGHDFLGQLRATMEEAFGTKLQERVLAVAHKLVPGQRIAIHNDYLVGEETHRLTLQLNRGLRDEDGGFFMLFNSDDASDVHRIVRPICGSGLGFEIGPVSYHAVSRLHGGERYTIVFSFYAHPRQASAAL